MTPKVSNEMTLTNKKIKIQFRGYDFIKKIILKKEIINKSKDSNI